MEKSLDQMADDIAHNHERCFVITGRDLLHCFGFERRTSGNCRVIEDYLNGKNLIVVPHYNDVWVDVPIKLCHKPVAKTSVSEDPIKRIKMLPSATQTPVFVKNDATLTEALTIMRMHDYSQLPVTTNGDRGLCGYVSWQTIGKAIANGVNSNVVKDYKRSIDKTLSLETPLLEAVHYINQHDFALIESGDKRICGIITTADISGQFITITEPFVRLGEIEQQIRILLNDKLLLEDIKAVCQEPGRNVNSIDDLTFGEYIALMQKDENWQKLNVNVDKKIFLKLLDEVREIRNDVMHFDPAGITETQYAQLRSAAHLLREINSYRKQN